MKNNLFLLGLFFIGITLGILSNRPQAPKLFRGISSDDKTTQFESVDCPDKKEMKDLFDQVHFEYIEEELNCQNEPNSLFAKALVYTKKLKIYPPLTLPEGIRKDLTDQFSYLAANASKINFDLNQVDSLAYNKTAVKEIFIGRRMFDDGPLEALMVLFHEARHSVEGSPGHVMCGAGDLSNFPGACDEEFSLDYKKAGAYSYSVILYLVAALYTDGLTAADREYSLTSGLSMLSGRFLNIPSVYGNREDVLALVDKNFEITFYNISDKSFEPFKYEVPKDQKIVRVEFAVPTGALMFFTDKGKMYTWSFSQKDNKLKPYFEKPLKKQKIEVNYVNRLYVTFMQGTWPVFQSKDKNLYYGIYDPPTNEMVLKPYPNENLRKKVVPYPNIKMYFQALNMHGAFLDHDGQFSFAPQYGNENPFRHEKNIPNATWIFGTGGVFGDGLYIVDEKGQIESFVLDYVADGDHDEPIIKPDSDSMIIPLQPIKQYIQGFQYEAFLGQNSNVYVRENINSKALPDQVELNTSNPPEKLIMMRKLVTPLKHREIGD